MHTSLVEDIQSVENGEGGLTLLATSGRNCINKSPDFLVDADVEIFVRKYPQTLRIDSVIHWQLFTL